MSRRRRPRRHNKLSISNIVNSGKTYLLLATGFGAYCAWSSTQELMPGWNTIFGKPSIEDTIIVFVVTFLLALLVLNVIRRLLTSFIH